MVLYVVFVAVSVVLWRVFHNLDILTGTLLGGGLSLINFELLKAVGRKIFEDPKRLKLQYFVFVWLKLMALIAICFAVVYYQAVNVPAFFASLGIIVAAIIGATIYAVSHGFGDLIDDEMQKSEEKFIGWDDVDNKLKKVYKPGAKKTVFD